MSSFANVPRSGKQAALSKRDSSVAIKTSKVALVELFSTVLREKLVETAATYSVDWVLDSEFKQEDATDRAVAIARRFSGLQSAQPAIIIQDTGKSYIRTLGGIRSSGRTADGEREYVLGEAVPLDIEVIVVAYGEAECDALSSFVTMVLGPWLNLYCARLLVPTAAGASWSLAVGHVDSVSAADLSPTSDGKFDVLSTRTISFTALYQETQRVTIDAKVRPRVTQSDNPRLDGLPEKAKPGSMYRFNQFDIPVGSKIVSSNPKVALIQDQAVVHARRVGTCTIEVRLRDGTKIAEYPFRVRL